MNDTVRSPDSHTALRLPKLDLTPFDGSYEAWQNFKDTFVAAIDRQPGLSAAQKFQYLKACLKDEAASILSALPITDANYQIALNILKERYENKRVLISNYLNKLTALPSVSQDNVSSLRLMRDMLQISLDSLRNLQCRTDDWGPLLIHQMVHKFSVGLRKEWEKSLAGSREYPDLVTFTTFLNNQIHILENISLHREYNKDENSSNSNKKNKSSLNSSVTSVDNKCPCCHESHQVYKCSTFIKLNVNERQKIRNNAKLCVNCLLPGHKLSDCKCQISCRKCNKRHHTLLHFDNKKEDKTSKSKHKSNEKSSNKEDTSVNNTGVAAQAETSTTLHSAPACSEVMLATALVRIQAPNGRHINTRAMIDHPGSESSFVSESLAQILKLPRHRTDVIITGLQGVQTSAPRFCTNFEVSAMRASSPHYSVNAFILQTITQYKPKSFKPENHHELQKLRLADPEPAKAYRIDVLLGADIFGQLLEPGLIHLRDSPVTAQLTKLGWILTGPVEPSRHRKCISVQHATHDMRIALQQFWEIEDFPNKTLFTKEDELCEDIFCNHTTRDESGRFCTALPFKSPTEHERLGESKSIAISSWKRVETRMSKVPELRQQYDEFMNEYLELDHMSEIPSDEEEVDKYVFLPHHAVVRQDSLTTKVRVVFNASCKTKSGVSLNDTLCTGPKLQNDIADVVTNWRRHRFVLTADVTKMFRQILIRPEDRHYQCILWRPTADSDIKAYKLNTVTYGTKPAPFLANRVIKAILEEHGDEFPLAIEPFDRCTYVDDVLFGADTREQVVQTRQQIETILQKGCLNLRKWVSNSPDLLPDTDSVGDEVYIEPIDNPDKKVLGITWSSKSDAFSIRLGSINTDMITKRIILSHIARLYDPLGWLSPLIVRAKVLLQSLWMIKTGWDDTDLPQDCINNWLKLCDELPNLSRLSITRHIGAEKPTSHFYLIGFCDASVRAYAAAVYLYIENTDGTVKSNLITVKSKVAPIKTLSIPRLELCGAVILTKLICKVKSSWLGKLDSIRCYTDSRIVLDWMAKHASTWHTFVANRVSFIQTALPEVKWKHISTKHNPADLNSRGMHVEDLINSNLWWHGPDTALFDSLEDLVEDSSQRIIEVEKETRRNVFKFVATQEVPQYLLRFSTWLKLVRVLAFWYKYITILQQKVKGIKITPMPALTLNSEYVRQATTHVFKVLQKQAFRVEFNNLQNGQAVSKGSILYNLCPFIDDQGLLRVGGRLEESQFSFSQRHPIILPKNRVTNLLIKHYHLKALHGGLQLTLTLLREEFWIIHARNSTKLVIAKCTQCIRHKAQTLSQQMAPLPKSRCAMSRPFTHTGVDYTGPFAMRNAAGRGQKSHKVWIAVFVCFSTRAVHLEVVNAYSTQAFLAAFKSFIARRGIPSDMYSDQGTNFVGADAELKRHFKTMIRDSDLQNTIASEGVHWHYIPPAAPHQGGIWESAVRILKRHLKRVMGAFIPTWEEMRTILCQIEACLNSRPLVPNKDDPSEDLALTPGHFLVGSNLKSVPEPSFLDDNGSLHSRWQTTSLIVQSFWNRWRKEYLQTLQRRCKWQDTQDNLKQGDIVLLKDANHSPCDWALAKVEEVRVGRDGLVRDVTLRTRNTTLHRPITQLVKLPID